MTIRAAGATDVGAQRVVNEDRFHVDPDRGVFIVVDGVGGQAAGGRAADTALEIVRTRLTQTNGPVAGRIRDAITQANNEVYRQASSRSEWQGMACVLTVAMVDGDRAIIGHVGDTRLYKLRPGAIEKITPDHSPVGEREDAGEISEIEAMRHPRRNEVYRDVGSEPHEASETDFIDLREIPLEPDAALLLCSDGLTDLVGSQTIRGVAERFAGNPEQVTRALVKAANDAGGKDNITVIYAEGERYAGAGSRAPKRSGKLLMHLTIWLLVLAGLAVAWRSAGYPVPDAVGQILRVSSSNVIVVPSGESIAAALERASPGTTILVEPGEYRERLILKNGVRLISRVPRGAVLRLPASATDEDAAVTAADLASAELAGFRITGDAATPLGTGVLARSASIRLFDLEISGAARAAVDLGAASDVMLLASHIHDNPGAGLAVRAKGTPRIAHNAFTGNGSSLQASGTLLVEAGARPVFHNNIFRNVDPQGLGLLDAAIRSELRTANWFPDAPTPTPAGRGRGRGR